MSERKNAPVYIFDLDGTLVDSMPYFTKGILSIADDEGIEYDGELVKILTPLGYRKSAEYYVNELGVNDSVESIYAKIEERLIREYTTNIVTKAGVIDYLRLIHGGGARLFVLTASPHSVTDPCLRRNGIYELFEQVWSVEDFGLSKSGVELFYKVADTVGVKPCEIHYFDDSLIALENAKRAGYITYGVYDAQSDEELYRMRDELADITVMSFEGLLH